MAENALRRATNIVTVSKSVAAELRESGLVDDRTSITPIPLGVTPLPHGDELINRRPYMLAVGTLEPRKNLLRLVDAFRKSKISKDFDLLIIGRVAWGKVPSADGVRVLSSATDQTLGSAYAQAHAFICPSIYEGFGLPIVEAASFGLPIACSDIPVFHEVTRGHAIFFDPFSEASMVNALRKLAYSKSPLVVPKCEMAKYTWENAATALSSILLNIP